MYRPISTNQFNRRVLILPGIVILVIIYIIIALLLPMPKVSGKTETLQPKANNLSALFWPTSVRQAAVGAEGYGVLATDEEQDSVPIASIAKTMLALTVIEQKPLQPGEQGPTLTMTQEDVDLYSQYLAKNGSVLPVNLNEKLTEYQLLQGLLIYSGDNIADTLAIWMFGSTDKYLEYVNNKAKEWGLEKTHFADTSGYSPETVSSARDLVIIGTKLLDEPVLAEIVNQSEADLPVVGTVKNYNTILGQENIIGIKTGTTDEAGGCLLFASKRAIGGKEINIVGALLGAPDRATVLQNTKIFLQRNDSAFSLEKVVIKGQVVGSYETPWGKSVNVVAKEDLEALIVDGLKITPQITLNVLTGVRDQGSEVGEISVEVNGQTIKTPAVLESKYSKPPVFWKVLHP